MKLQRVLWGCIILISVFWLNTLLTRTFSESDLTYYSGTFNNLQYHKVRGGSVSYSVFLNEFERHFKIGADYVTCFDHKNFDLRVHKGDSLSVGMTGRNGLLQKGSVASLKTKWHSFFDLECRTKKDNKISKLSASLIYGLMILLLGFFLVKIKRANNNHS